MDQQTNNPRFPEQSESGKIHGEDVRGNEDMKEKYIRDAGKIEDYPSQDEVAKMNAPSGEDETAGLTDMSGEEKKEDYINTDERKKDLEQRRHH